jgi:hypothetical protein
MAFMLYSFSRWNARKAEGDGQGYPKKSRGGGRKRALSANHYQALSEALKIITIQDVHAYFKHCGLCVLHNQ